VTRATRHRIRTLELAESVGVTCACTSECFLVRQADDRRRIRCTGIVEVRTLGLFKRLIRLNRRWRRRSGRLVRRDLGRLTLSFPQLVLLVEQHPDGDLLLGRQVVEDDSSLLRRQV